jgi:hypothetical protein
VWWQLSRLGLPPYRDRFWNGYELLGVVLLAVSVFIGVSFALGCLALFKIWQSGVLEKDTGIMPP